MVNTECFGQFFFFSSLFKFLGSAKCFQSIRFERLNNFSDRKAVDVQAI